MTIKEFTGKTKKMSGIYCWFSKTSKKSYIGSSVDIGNRTGVEYNELTKQKFLNPEMQKDWDAFGEDDFCLILMRKCNEDKLLEMETKFIVNGFDLYNRNIPITKIELNKEQEELFWKHIDIKDKNECWDWTGFTNPGGYGSGLFRKNGKRMPYIAHRVAYFLTNPGVDIHCIICHKCDNRKCCNPDHLFPGSTSDNIKDMRDKNRSPKQILNWEDVRFIRSVYLQDVHINAEKLSQTLFDKTGKIVTPNNIISLCKNKSWYDKNYNPPPRNIGDIKEELLIEFYNKPDISLNEIIRWIYDKYQIKTDRESVSRLFKGRQSKFERNKKDKPELIKLVLELKSQGFTHNEVVSYLEEKGITVSYNSIWRILKSQKESI